MLLLRDPLWQKLHMRPQQMVTNTIVMKTNAYNIDLLLSFFLLIVISSLKHAQKIKKAVKYIISIFK